MSYMRDDGSMPREFRTISSLRSPFSHTTYDLPIYRLVQYVIVCLASPALNVLDPEGKLTVRRGMAGPVHPNAPTHVQGC